MAGEARPRHIIRAPLPPKGNKMLRSNEKAAWLEILSPLLDSLITDFLLCRPQDRRVVVVEPFAGPSAVREALAEVLFLNLGVPTVSFVYGLLPVLYASGGLSGIVLDVGKDEVSTKWPDLSVYARRRPPLIYIAKPFDSGSCSGNMARSAHSVIL